jgi:hypothetical protein
MSMFMLTGMTGISLHMQWPLTSQSHGIVLKENNCFFITNHAIIQLHTYIGVSLLNFIFSFFVTGHIWPTFLLILLEIWKSNVMMFWLWKYLAHGPDDVFQCDHLKYLRDSTSRPLHSSAETTPLHM